MNLKKFLYSGAYIVAIMLLTVLLVNCGKENKTGENSQKREMNDTSKKTTSPSETGSGQGTTGREIFYMKSSVNNIACADCHSDGTNTSNPLTKYFSSVHGADKRTSTYNGKFTGEEVRKNAAGATVCWETYLRMKTPMTEHQVKSLNDFYALIADSEAPSEIKYESIALPKKDKSKLKDIQKIVMELKGDPVKGGQTFDVACGSCHAENATVKRVPTILEEFEGNIKSITFNVRLGDGSMPFFKKESLSDQDLADISAYIMKKTEK
jgi:mono/diheme cytochrome c family protein